MVKHGLFGLGLVRAEKNEWTGELYQEHSCPSSTDIYAEVEPEDEFYLQLRSDAPEVVYADLRVDGLLIERGHRVWPGTTTKVGLIRADATDVGSGTEVALRFARAQVYRSRERAATFWTGQVEVTFYGNPSYRIPPESSPMPYSRDVPVQPENAAVAVPPVQPPAVPVVASNNSVSGATTVTYAARKNIFYLNPSLASSDVGYVPGKSTENQKKGVKSAEGTTRLRQHEFQTTTPNKPKNFTANKKEPENLGTITVRYCSTIGLIHAGILTKPPLWENERMKNAYNKRKRDDDWKALSEAKVTKLELTSERINAKGEKVVEKKEVDLFDLSNE